MLSKANIKRHRTVVQTITKSVKATGPLVILSLKVVAKKSLGECILIIKFSKSSSVKYLV